MTIENLTAAVLIMINLAAFSLYGIDKRRAIEGKWRITEATLLTIAICGGAVGAYVGMRVFHHKTKKPKFYIGVPLSLLLWAFIAGIVIKC